MVDDPLTLDGAGSKHELGAAISETLGVLAAPGTLNESESRLATADSTVPPLEASTQSALAAEDRAFDDRTSRIACFRAPNICTVLSFVAGIASSR